ncbi:hypothetical protein CAWG_05656 [Candida albicans WO-1]|uniref:Uncharacterized protein n=1 Tax=Candida albicans (strain WO-1) TaxID=294748 RepID=C4YSW1_CANAW|nr:hypothetical protein CAWG_05656 [Candida albicans WO-1]
MFHHFQSHRFLIGSTKLLFFFFFLSLSFTFFKLCSYSIATSPSVYQFLFNLLLLFFFFFLLFHSSTVARYSCLYNINCIILKLLIPDTSVENLSCLFYFIPQTKSSSQLVTSYGLQGSYFLFKKKIK